MSVVYKVVRSVGVEGRSVGHLRPLRYRLHFSTRAPKGTGILCFRRLTDAIVFKAQMSPGALRIMRVRATGAVRLPRRRLPSHSGPALARIKAVWLRKEDGCPFMDWPTGTVAYQTITPYAWVD